MIIHPVEIQPGRDGVRVSARIEFASGHGSGTDTLWYEFPRSEAAHFSGSADGFVTALLLLAMAGREDIQVRGVLNRRLLDNLREYQRVFSAWFPKRFFPVAIECEGWSEPPAPDAPRTVATAFSGGVDSSYTLFSHLPANEWDPSRRIDHALFVHGFDIPLHDETTFDKASEMYDRELRALGVELLTARTNVRHFVDALPWQLTHGTALGSVALMLDRLLGLFYIPASFHYTELTPWGSHPVSDPLMSTDRLLLIHDGCLSRTDKIARVAEHAPARGWLRVCWEKPNASQNCCQCYNCLLTMASLEIAGALSECSTFPEPLSRSRVRRMLLPKEELLYTRKLAERAMAAGRPDLAEDLQTAWRSNHRALTVSRIRRRLRSLTRSLARRLGRQAHGSSGRAQ
jgi:hypothetical protein